MTTTYGHFMKLIDDTWAGSDSAPGPYSWAEIEAATGHDSHALRSDCRVDADSVAAALPDLADDYDLLVEGLSDLVEVPDDLAQLRERIEHRLWDEADRQWCVQMGLD